MRMKMRMKPEKTLSRPERPPTPRRSSRFQPTCRLVRQLFQPNAANEKSRRGDRRLCVLHFRSVMLLDRDLFFLGRHPELVEGPGFDLPDPLLGHAKRRTHF